MIPTGDLLDLADHIRFTRDLVRAAQMAAVSVQDAFQRQALDSLLDTILDRADSAKETLEAIIEDQRGGAA